MASNIYKKYMWLVRLLSRQRTGLTFEQISDHWQRSSLNDYAEPLSKRTFHNWINAIGENLGVYIECTKTAPYRYRLENANDLQDNLMDWALKAFSMGQLIADNKDIRERILLEDIPSADDRLETILNAMRHNHRIRLCYKKFGSQDVNIYITDPYAVKLSRKRWYVICHSDLFDREFIYGIDRIVAIEEIDETFIMRDGFSAEQYFAGRIGVTTYEDLSIETIRLKITGYLRDYIQTLPLHTSQRLVEQTTDYSIYEYHLCPDYELVDIITGLGSCCEVLEPLSLREKIHSHALSLAEKNK